MPADSEFSFHRSIATAPYYAVLQLLWRAEDPAVWPLLPDLFGYMQSVATTEVGSADHYDDDIVRAGIAASATILKNVGFDLSNSLHSSIWNWIAETTESENLPLAAAAIYSLEKLGIPPPCVQDQLLKLMTIPPMAHPNWIGTRRAVAFRVLMRLNKQEAILHVGQPSSVDFREMANSLRDMLINSGKSSYSVGLLQEFEDELSWLNNAV